MFVVSLPTPRVAAQLAPRPRWWDVAVAEDPASRQPRIDVIEHDADYTVVLDMPGVAKDAIEITVEGQRVKVASRAAKAEETPVGERLLYRERGSAPYARTIVLPDEVDSSAAQARLDNGVLTLILAKRAAARLTQVQVS